jgi:hypothetical protein
VRVPREAILYDYGNEHRFRGGRENHRISFSQNRKQHIYAACPYINLDPQCIISAFSRENNYPTTKNTKRI